MDKLNITDNLDDKKSSNPNIDDASRKLLKKRKNDEPIEDKIEKKLQK